ncbi:MAG TPA: DNA polymerase III subunit chi [Acidisphaera sp.]|nr:DNA polymerase III subunit chi [Acidisphaera sp.]
MTEWGFYHCTRTKPQAALPRLLGRTLQAGERAVVLCGDAHSVAAIDAALWQCKDPDWLPHGTEADGDADLQPIWVTARPEAPNGARFLFLLDNAAASDAGAWSRIFDLFDGNDEAAVAAARTRWTAAKAAGHALTYWQQGANGWQKKAD